MRQFILINDKNKLINQSCCGVTLPMYVSNEGNLLSKPTHLKPEAEEKDP